MFMLIRNGERRRANVSLIILIIGVYMICNPFIKSADMMKWGYASIYVGIFITLVALICFSLFNKRAVIMKKIILKEGILASWEFSKDIDQKLDKEAYENAKMTKVASLILAVIIAIIAIIMSLLDGEVNNIFLFIMFGVSIIIILAGQLSSFTTLRKLNKNNDETIFIKEGVFFRGDLFCWDVFLTKLECVVLDPVNNKNILMIYKQLHGRHLYRIRYMLSIPIPKDKLGEAEKIISCYGLYPSSEILQYIRGFDSEN
jgi:heme/copper-type cytochrome/quinol oxidase subunit 4